MRISTNIKLLLFHATLRTRALPYFCAYFAFILLNTRHSQIISIKFSMILLSFHIYNTSLYFSHIAIFYLKPSCSHYDCIKPILSKIKQILVESEKFYGQYLIPFFLDYSFVIALVPAIYLHILTAFRQWNNKWPFRSSD